jgi:hypothetical protein
VRISEKYSSDMIVAFQYMQIYELMLAVKSRYCNSSSIAVTHYASLHGELQNKVISSKYLAFVPHLRKKVGL